MTRSTHAQLLDALGIGWPFLLQIIFAAWLNLAESAINPRIAFAIEVAIILLAFAWVWFFSRRKQQEVALRLPTLGESEPATPRKGVIVLVSAGAYATNPARVAALFHLNLPPGAAPDAHGTLKHAWLIHTAALGPDADEKSRLQSSYVNAELLAKELFAHGVTPHKTEVVHEDDAYEVYTKARNIYTEARSMRFRPDALSADVTGGTKAMTIGLALAGLPLERDQEYTRANKKDANGRPIFEAGSSHMMININFVHGPGD